MRTPEKPDPLSLEVFLASAERSGDLVQEVFGTFNASSYRAAELYAFINGTGAPTCKEAITGNPGHVQVLVDDGQGDYTIQTKPGYVRVFTRSPRYEDVLE